MSIPYAIAVAVGPDPKELERVSDLIESVRAYEPGPCHFVMIDDSPEDRDLPKALKFPEGWKPASVAASWPRPNC